MKKCPCCENKKIELKYAGLYDKSYLKKGKFDLFVCKNCRLEFVNPILDEKELGKYYPAEEYYSFYDYNKLALVYHKISALYHSKNNFFVNVFLSPFSPLLYTYYIKENLNVLEIGCGNGMKLDIYQKYGAHTSGLEPYGPELGRKERKLGIQRKNIQNVEYKDNNFDCIILKEVLEHIPNQREVLEKCYKWLKPNGKMIITVPNTSSLLKNIFSGNWFGYDVPRHVYNYNPNNISYYLKKFGFKINKIRKYDPPYMLDGSIKFRLVDKTGKKNHPIVFSNLTKILLVPISLFITYIGQGSLMEIDCTKPIYVNL